MSRIPFGRLAVVALVLMSMLALPMGAVAQETTDQASNETTSNESEYSLDELRSGGQSLDDAPEGVRVDGERMWWLEHWPADAVFAEPGSMQSSDSEFVGRGALVDRNSVYLRTVAVDNERHEERLKIVYWERGSEERVTESGETVEQTVVENVTVDHHNVTFGAGMPSMEVPLRQSNDARQVTMWLESDPSVRWTFTHDSVATAQASGIETQGDFLSAVAVMFLAPVLVGSVVAGFGARRVIERAGMGPGMSLVTWLVLVVIGTALLLAWQFSTVAELLAAAPYVAAGLVIVFVGIVVLESQSIQSRDVLFFRPDVESVRTPRDGEGADAIMGAVQQETIIEMSRGPAIVRSGLVPFLSRMFGSAARVPSVAFETRIRIPTGPVDEMILVDPDADTVLDYQPEGFQWDFSLPDDLDKRDAGLFVLGVAGVTGSLIWALGTPVVWIAGALVVLALAYGLEAVDGRAHVQPADAHVRSAWVSTMTLEKEVQDAQTLGDARELIVEQQSRTESEIQEAIERQDGTLVEEMLGQDIDRSIESEQSNGSNPLDDIDSIEEFVEEDPDAGVVENDD